MTDQSRNNPIAVQASPAKPITHMTGLTGATQASTAAITKRMKAMKNMISERSGFEVYASMIEPYPSRLSPKPRGRP